MDPWTDVRLRARACHAEALAESRGDRSAQSLLAAALRLRRLAVVRVEPATRLNAGVSGLYERAAALISVDATLSAVASALVSAHAIGQHELHVDPAEEVIRIDAGRNGPASLVGESRRERREIAADHFAAEFLCPSDWLASEIVDRGRRPSEVARELGLPTELVNRQAIRGTLLPPLRPRAARLTHAAPLDPSQAAAAAWAGGPVLVEAGPGTGKTETLVGRIRHLLASGVHPSSILVLTFSTKAAAELRARVAEAAPKAADALWAGTFHAFGREVIGRWHHRVGRGSRPRVLDRGGALDLLERNLARLPLARFRDLGHPAAGLATVLRAIERAKDEMVTPEDYAEAAHAMMPGGTCAAAASALEVAGIYRVYQKLLEDDDAVDLGDLVALAVRLLEQGDVALHYGSRFSHVLVDEYQDSNGASVRMLRSLCGPESHLWVVADARQSIYRFRGAQPGNVERFPEAFGGDVVALARTYRATPQIVAAFSAFAGAMSGASAAWIPARADGDPVRLMSAPTLAGEAAAVRDRIETLRAAGVGYGEQAILARTHAALERVGAGLERLGVPIQYLGDLFVRPEVRDLLALVSLGTDPDGLGLLRVATQAPYGVPRREVAATIRWMAASGTSVADALARPQAIAGVGEDGIRGLALLGRHLAANGERATAWTVMVTWLFELHPASDLAGTAERSPMRLAAIYQLLRLAADEGCGRRAFLARVRRIAALGGGRDHGIVAPEAESGDAVRLMTVHAAKGLEFPAVHLPMASSQHVPMAQREAPCPPPPGLARLSMGPEDHDAEERCLWFVALSRARDHLAISHAARYVPGREARVSPFLAGIGPVAATRHPDVAVPDASPSPLPQETRPAYPLSQLDTYLLCPARYRYEIVDGLGGGPASAHRKFLTAFRAAVRLLEEGTRHATAMPSYQDAAAALETAWDLHGPRRHPHEGFLRAVADASMTRMAEIVATEVGARYRHEDWVVDVGNGLVLLRPHRVVEQPCGTVTVQILRSRRGRARLEGLQALLMAGGRTRFRDARIVVETFDLETGDVVEADMPGGHKALAPYRDAIAAIEAGAFAARPNARACPSCPYFFICGA